MTANCERKFDRVWQEQWWSSASLSSQSRWRRKQIKISRDERQLSSPCQTVDVALASEPGLDRSGGTDDLQALDQVLRGENISIFRKYFNIITHLAEPTRKTLLTPLSTRLGSSQPTSGLSSADIKTSSDFPFLSPLSGLLELTFLPA